MEKHRKHRASYQASVLRLLLASTLIAGAFAMLFAYFHSRASIQAEVAMDETELALSMLEARASTGLSDVEIAALNKRDSLTISLLLDDGALGSLERAVLRQQGYVTIAGGTGLPKTYVQLRGVFSIEPSVQYNPFSVVILRIWAIGVAFTAIFVLMSLLASMRIADPVKQLTRASEQVAQGDYGVRVPPGSNAEINELITAFNSMIAAIGKSDRAQRDFISNVSHEFRTPIASIKGNTRLLQLPGLTEEERQRIVADIAAESDRLSRLSTALLRLSALDAGARDDAFAPERLDEQLRQVIAQLDAVWADHRTEWEIDLEQVTIVTDGELLRQVWVNLIENALKFSPEGSPITVTLKQDGQKAVVTVRDQGRGMTREEQEHIFDSFYQADGSRSGKGHGVGLYLVRRVLQLLGGSVSVESAPGRGSAFTVRVGSRENSKEA